MCGQGTCLTSQITHDALIGIVSLAIMVSCNREESVMRLAAILLCSLCLTACVSSRTAQIENEKSAAMRGKVVATTDRPRAGLVAMTPGKAMFGMIGAAAMIEAGNMILDENNIRDPAPLVNRALLTAAQKQFGVVPATTAPVHIDTTDVNKLAAAAGSADILFDVQNVGRGFRYMGFKFGSYAVESSYKFRIIDVRAKKMIAEGFCFQSTKDDPNPPSHDELLADKATRLKAILDAQQDVCTNQFATQVLNLPVKSAST